MISKYILCPFRYITGNVSNEVVDQYPQIYPCPAGEESCRPTTVVGAMAAPLTSGACQLGHAGAVCDACEAGFVQAPAHRVCVVCEMNRGVSWGIFVGVTLGVIVIALFVVHGIKKTLRPPPVERWLKGRIHDMELKHGLDGAADWMVDNFAVNGQARKSPTKKGATHIPSSPLDSGAREEKTWAGDELTKNDLAVGFHRMGIDHTVKDLDRLWKHIDTDNSGTMSFVELRNFIHGLRSGDAGKSRCRTAFRHLQTWWDSNRSSTVRTIILGYMQCLSAIPKLYGGSTSHDGGDTQRSSSQASASSSFISPAIVSPSATSSNHSNVYTSDGSDSKEDGWTVERISAIVSTVDFSQYNTWFRCLIGPRYPSTLVFYTAIPIVIILLTASVPILLQAASKEHWHCCGVARCRSIVPHEYRKTAKTLVSRARNMARQFTSLIVFILYPMSARVVLYGFKCQSFIDGTTTKASWLLQDKLVKCPLNNDSQYWMYYGYAIAMVLLVVIGWPLVSWALLRPWQYPMQRLYTINEDGSFTPALDARRSVGMLFVMYRPRWWSLEVGDMMRKLLLTSGIAIIFAGADGNNCLALVVSSVFCVLVLFLFTWFKPLAYKYGNSLQMIVHACLALVYMDRIVVNCGSDPTAGPQTTDTTDSVSSATLEGMVVTVRWAPFAVAMLDLLRVDVFFHYVRKTLSSLRCGAQTNEAFDTASRAVYSATQITKHYFHVAARRARRIDELHQTLLAALRQASHHHYHGNSDLHNAISLGKDRLLQVSNTGFTFWIVAYTAYIIL